MRFKLFTILAVILLLSGCSFFPEQSTTGEYKSPYATDVNGEFVPAHENVEESTLDPKLFYCDENGRMCYNDNEQLLLTGIDVSVFQGEIDWEQVAADNIDFVMLRVGFRGYGSKGLMEVDANFLTNYHGAVDAGLDVGVYFYSQATTAAEAIEEADLVLETIQGLNITYPVAFDWEYVDNAQARTANMTGLQITECAKAFCDRISSAGYTSVIYFNCEIGYFEYDLSQLTDYDFWLAEYGRYPSFLYDYKMWQYTADGTVSGISGAVDINVSLVDYAEQIVEYG